MIYFIRNTRSKSVKIGWSDKPAERLKSQEDTLELVGTVQADRSDEHRLHKALRADRLNGEWFKPGAVDQLVALCGVTHKVPARLLPARILLHSFFLWAERDPQSLTDLANLIERGPTEQDLRAFFDEREERGLLL